MAAVACGSLMFAFRVLGDSGLSNDHYMHLAWAQQVLLGDVPGRDFVDPGMPLMYAASAAVQALWPGPLSELVLASAMMALAAGLTCWLAATLTGSVLLGTAAALVEILLPTRLYGYPKILVPPLVLTALYFFVRKPTTVRLVVLGVCTAVAMLLRHDLGALAWAAAMTGLLVAGDRSDGLGLGFRYSLVTALLLLPYAAAVQWSVGLVEAFREALEFARGDAHQFLAPWSLLPQLAGSGPRTSPAIWLFYVCWTLIAAGWLLVLTRQTDRTCTGRPVAVAALVLLSCYAMLILRHPPAGRVPDMAAVLAIAGAWIMAELGATVRLIRRPVPRLLLATGLGVCILSAATAAVAMADLESRVGRTGISRGTAGIAARVAAVHQAGTKWPWARYWPAGEVPQAIDYLRQCTGPRDRVLVTWFAPEYYFFSQRGFGAGHAYFSPPRAFTDARDRAKMVRRLESQPVPVVLINETARAEFAAAYPELDAFLQESYRPAGAFTIRDGSQITIGVRTALEAFDAYGPDRWPCGFMEAAATG